MFSFEGDFKSKRSQNLGGKSKKEEDRESVLRRLKAEREARAEEKNRQLCATKIQAFFRAKYLLHRLRTAEQSAFLVQYLSHLDCSSIPTETLANLLSHFLFAYGARADIVTSKPIFEAICSILVRRIQNREDASIFLCPASTQSGANKNLVSILIHSSRKSNIDVTFGSTPLFFDQCNVHLA
eukprot:TRINITY_DN21144_c0_g1::TRINITY_DN21144_c0_g1_i1::g.30070::m.30070 TRINITY_DN21144_c0_g1::TRINITY_DN21144_c0_g1_i1::g.30070  ORF type:complete len:183 (-),score=-3.17,DUF2514/PF10721.4/0.086 TRINITY_DN21144_c0_g1_i1:63-611(-)